MRPPIGMRDVVVARANFVDLRQAFVHIAAVRAVGDDADRLLPRVAMRRRSRAKAKRRLKFSTPGRQTCSSRTFRPRTWEGWSCIAEVRLKPKEYEQPVYLIRHQNTEHPHITESAYELFINLLRHPYARCPMLTALALNPASI